MRTLTKIILSAAFVASGFVANHELGSTKIVSNIPYGLGYIANLAMGTAHTKCMTYNGATRATLSFNGEQMAKGAGSYDHLVSGEKYSVTRIDYPFGMSGVKVAGEKCN